uniref:Sal-like protein 1 n=2 Tax=Lygus hesperus TaxID=30085 RepID=A0A0A9VYS5_LYGHE
MVAIKTEIGYRGIQKNRNRRRDRDWWDSQGSRTSCASEVLVCGRFCTFFEELSSCLSPMPKYRRGNGLFSAMEKVGNPRQTINFLIIVMDKMTFLINKASCTGGV